MLNTIKNTGMIIGIAFSVFFVSFVVFAWTSPPGAPPTCPAGEPGCETPLHTGTVGQSKTGGLLLNTGGASTGLIVEHGNVGIGTTSPGAKLDIYNTADLGTGANGIRVQRPGVYGQYGYLEYLANSDQTILGSLYTGGGANVYGQIYFRQHSSSATRDAMVINSSGNVGIGTTNPIAKLHVLGIGAGDGTALSGGILIENNNATIGEPAVLFKNNNTDSNYWFTGLNQSAHYDIAYGAGFTNANTNMRINSDGNVGIGTVSPQAKLHIQHSTAGHLIRFQVPFGWWAMTLDNNSSMNLHFVRDGALRSYIQANGTYTVHSDKRAKMNIENLDYGLKELLQLQPSRYDYILSEGKSINSKDIGLISQEVYNIIPEAVDKIYEPHQKDASSINEWWGISYDKFIPVLINGIKEQQEQIDELRAEIEKLNSKQH